MQKLCLLWIQNPLVHKYLWNKPAQEIEEVIKVIQYVQRQYQENKIGRFATILKETGEIHWLDRN